MIEIVIFEDSLMTPERARRLCREVPVPTRIKVYGTEDNVDWHGEWNALGDYAAAELNKRSTTVASPESYEAALEWCLATTGRAICFFDYEFGRRISVTPDQVSRVGNLALRVSGESESHKASIYFNKDAQGLLLAAALATNPKPDVDIWLATSIHAYVDNHVRVLTQGARQGIFVGKADESLVKSLSENRPLQTIKKAVDTYSERRKPSPPLEQDFWPDYADRWFTRDMKTPAPHNHVDFKELEEADKQPVTTYLQGLGVAKETADHWLDQFGCYETLKQFVGGLAAAHSGDRPLTLGSLIMPLLKATPNTSWAGTLKWEVTVRPIGSPEKTESRRLVLAILRLFETLSRPRSGLGELHEVAVEFAKKTDGTHLLVDFFFDCSVGKDVTEPSLIAKCQFFPWKKPQGDTSEAFCDVLQATDSGDQDRKLFVSVYPVKRAADTWTRLDFKANS